MLGPVSGCHVNPAVTVGLLISGNCTILKALCYVVCQCCGAIAGSAILKVRICTYLFHINAFRNSIHSLEISQTPMIILIHQTNQYPIPTDLIQSALPAKATQQGLGMTLLGNGVTSSQGILIEAIITFLLVLVVHGVTDPKREDCKGWAPMAIGLSISVSHLAAVPLTGSSMNPARSLGPAVIIGLWTDQWIYWVGPMIGALVAGALYKISLRARNKEDEQASYDF